MKVINIHHRILNQASIEIGNLLDTLSSDNDMMLATNKWSPMKLDKGLQVGSKGGHGPIRYFVIDYQPKKSIQFQFDMLGFDGFHQFDIIPLGENKTQLTHTIDMTTTGAASLKWSLAIRWLHDAYIEDAFDKVENHFTGNKKRSDWNIWVKILRKIMKPRNKN